MQIHKQFVAKKLLVVFFLWFMLFPILPMALYSQTVSNVTAQQVDKTIHVSYDLDMQAEISLHLSIDGGKTYAELHKLSGDVGKNVAEGHKTIVWDVLAERESLVGDDVLFLVKAEQGKNLYFSVNGITFKMIYVDGGNFIMGCTPEQGKDCLDDEKPSHPMNLNDFYIGETEVTQALWVAVMGTEPTYNGGWENKYGRGSDYPAYRISWNNCQDFLKKLNQLTGKTFRLPFEAEWEYAARGGSCSKHFKYSGGNRIKEIAWYNYNCNSTHLVKTKLPNEIGIYDMSGNVWEWCNECFYSYSDPVGSTNNSQRVIRGGGWYNEAWFNRISYRGYLVPNDCNYNLGFRLALSVE